MKFVSCFFVFVMCINTLFFSCNGQPKKISNNLQSDPFRKDIGNFEASQSFRNQHNNLLNHLGLKSLENGFDSLEIRIFRGKASTDTGYLLILTNTNSRWTANFTQFNYNYDKQNRSIDTNFVEKHPISGWRTVLDSIFQLGILTLPDFTTLQEYYLPTDAGGVTVEYAAVNKYKMYSYGAPELNEEKFIQAKKIMLILKLLDKEFGIHQYFEIPKSQPISSQQSK